MQTKPAAQTPSPAADRPTTLANQTRDEHGALLMAMHKLEAALASAAPGRELPWNHQVIESLREVGQALAKHVTSAEAPSGLFAEIDLRPTLLRRVERLGQEHAELLQAVQALQRRVEHYNENDLPDFQDIRQRAAWLLTALRHHQAAETDLIFESFYTDLGVGD